MSDDSQVQRRRRPVFLCVMLFVGEQEGGLGPPAVGDNTVPCVVLWLRHIAAGLAVGVRRAKEETPPQQGETAGRRGRVVTRAASSGLRGSGGLR